MGSCASSQKQPEAAAPKSQRSFAKLDDGKTHAPEEQGQIVGVDVSIKHASGDPVDTNDNSPKYLGLGRSFEYKQQAEDKNSSYESDDVDANDDVSEKVSSEDDASRTSASETEEMGEEIENKKPEGSYKIGFEGCNVSKMTGDKEEDNGKGDGCPKQDQQDVEKFEMIIKSEDSDKEKISSLILSGDMNIEIPLQIKLVRIFTSSTFTDTFHERNALMRKVYHRLKEYCQSRGYDFQVVDMRWGVRDEATDDHMTSELCMKELKACQKLSTGPNFITLLGQKYGYRPFKAKIFEKEFEVMTSSIENVDDVNLLEKWFIRDDNLSPPMYILQPIRDLIPNYNNWLVTAEDRSKASSEWWGAFERMQVVLRDAAEKCLLNEEEISKYKISVTEDEIRRGIMDIKDKKKHCFWFERRITDIENYLDRSKSRFFIDKIGKCLDEDAVALLNNLKSQVQNILTDENTKKYDVRWHGEDGMSPGESEEHRLYIEQLCCDFFEVLVEMIDKGIEEKSKQSFDDDLIGEISEHAITCLEKSKTFYGRNDVLDSILQHVESSKANRVLVIHGESGSGKTSILAVAARKIKEIHPEAPVILRFLGTTAESSTVRSFLRSICTQIYRIIGKNPPAFPEALQEIFEYFEATLKKVKSKMIIILDSLDQISSQDKTFNLRWMPKKIRQNLTFILSTIPGDEYRVLPALKARLPVDSFIEVPKMESKAAGFILSAWLKTEGHKLTSKQREIVMNAFNQCPLPLYLKLSFDQSLKWRSYSHVEKIALPLTVKEVINALFANMEHLHGKCLVRRSLGYLTAAKFGLSDAEMEDVLSLDDDVLNDVYQYWTPPLRRIPPLLWVRIKSDLSSYIVSRGVDGLLLNTWYHRQFFETATQRYLQPDAASIIHEQIADYFEGRWAGVRKPFSDKNGKVDEQDRLLAAQPNVFASENGNEERFNFRKLNELPFHLIQAGNLASLMEEFAINFDFLQTKLRACGLRNLLQDLKDAGNAFPDAREVSLIGKCIEMSGAVLLDDPYQLAGQLTSRMSHLKDCEGVMKLLAQSRQASVKCLFPAMTCHPGPGGPLIHSLSGHQSMVNRACLSAGGRKLISISEDETMKLWDVTSGEELQSFAMETDYSDVRFYNETNCVVVAGSYGMFAIDLNTEEVVFNEEDIDGLYGKCIDIFDDGKAMVHIGPKKVKLFQIEKTQISFAWEYEEKADQNSEGIADIVSGSREFYAYTRGNINELIIRSSKEVEFQRKITVPYGLRHFQFHGDQMISLGTNSEFQQLTEMHLVIWDTSSWDIILDKMSQFHPMISTLYDVTIVKTANGMELIWPVLNQINFWNLETGQERAALKVGLQGGSYKQALCSDGQRLIVTEADVNKSSIQIYDIDYLDFDDSSDSDFSEFERFQRYAGSGEKDAYLTEGSIVLSMPYSDPVLTVWSTEYQTPLRRIYLNGVVPFTAKYIDDDCIAIWDTQSQRLICVNAVEGKIESVSSGKVGEILSHFTFWQRIGKYSLLTTSEIESDLVLWDLKTGKELKRYTINRPESVTNFMVSEDESTAVVSLRDKSNSDATPPAISFDLESQSIKAEISVDDQFMQLEPEKTVLSSDGSVLYLTFWGDCIHKINTATGETVGQLHYSAEGESSEDIDEYTVFYCINSSSALGFLVAYLTCQVNEDSASRLVAFDLENDKQLAWNDCLVYRSTQISKDGSRMLGISSPLTDQSMTLELWDMSKVKEGKLTILGRFIPESSLRFSYLTGDGRSVCCGFTGLDGIVFLRVCGDDEEFKTDKECIEVSVDLTNIK